MGTSRVLLLVFSSWLISVQVTHELQSYETQVLLQLRKHLEYPSQLELLSNYNGDLCNLSSTSHLRISCKDNSAVTELNVIGDKNSYLTDFSGYAIPNKTLSEGFSMDSFVTTLTRLSSLRVLILVSLGIWGSLPEKIHRLSSLEILDLSSNFMFGSIPAQISRLVKLQSLTLDGNYFNDTIPDSFRSMSKLTVFSLRGNRLKGKFPSSITTISKLTDIVLCHNELSGELPDMSGLFSLHLLDLRENQFDSELPFIPQGLVTALLSGNSFSGEIPEQFGKLNQLQHLDLSFNHLRGTPPSALFSLPNISYLNLASNMLNGSLPKHLTCSSKLGFVDVSGNKFRGELPSCLDNISGKRVVKSSGNCFSINGKQEHQVPDCGDIDPGKESSRGKIAVLVPAIVGVALAVVVLLIGVLVVSKRCCSQRKFETHIRQEAVQDNPTSGVSSEVLANARYISEVVKLGAPGAPVCRLFSLEELKEATRNFSSSVLLGEGSSGKLYKGRLENGTYVAIRCLTLSRKYSIQNLKVRIDLLSKLHHPHLVCPLGHCLESSGLDDSGAMKLFLVYEYVSNGNYRMHLSGLHLDANENFPQKELKWSDRLSVLIGVAKAVHFLHTGIIPGVFNNRLKTNNVLLDEHQIAKLSDYGMSTIMDANDKLEAKGDCTKSSRRPKTDDDVYNLGFILLESLVGPIASGKGEAFLLSEMASFGSQDGRRRMVDPVVLTTCSQESLSIVVSITSKCICPEASSRPSVEDVLWNLHYAAQVQAQAEAEAEADQKKDSTP